jgi:pyruvate/2-oxoglutarate dehydrogenase complex dihydrolipoamide acyltransferase (E2) component
VLELETDKATIEVPSDVEGVVKEIRVKTGDKVKVGAVVLTVDPSTAQGAGDGAGAAAVEQPSKAEAEHAPSEHGAQQPAAKEPAAKEPGEREPAERPAEKEPAAKEQEPTAPAAKEQTAREQAPK